MPPKYWKDAEAAFVAKVQETAAVPRKRKKNYPKGASPESDSDEDTQKNPAPKPKKPKQKKIKSTATTTKTKSKSSRPSNTQPPPPLNHANDANEATEDSPSDVAGENAIGTSGVDGEGLFDNSDVEFDPIANSAPFDDDVEEDSGGEVTIQPYCAAPAVVDTSATEDTMSAAPAASAVESSLPATTTTTTPALLPIGGSSSTAVDPPNLGGGPHPKSS